MTTTVDTHGDQFAREALESLVTKVTEGMFLVTVQHNPRIQPVGRVLAAKVFFAPESQEYFVAGVIGYWDPASYKTFESIGDLCSVAEDLCVSGLDLENPPQASIELNRQDFNFQDFDDVLTEAPLVVSKDIDERFRKAQDPITIVTISASISLLLSTPFLKEIQKKFGAATADACIGFFR